MHKCVRASVHVFCTWNIKVRIIYPTVILAGGPMTLPVHWRLCWSIWKSKREREVKGMWVIRKKCFLKMKGGKESVWLHWIVSKKREGNNERKHKGAKGRERMEKQRPYLREGDGLGAYAAECTLCPLLLAHHKRNAEETTLPRNCEISPFEIEQ